MQGQVKLKKKKTDECMLEFLKGQKQLRISLANFLIQLELLYVANLGIFSSVLALGYFDFSYSCLVMATSSNHHV